MLTGIVARSVLLAVLYWIGVRIGLEFFIGQVSILWPANGIALAFFISTSIREWPWLVVATAIGYFIGLIGLDAQSTWVKIGFLIANYVEIIPAAVVIRLAFFRGVELESLRGILTFIGAGVVMGPTYGSLIAALVAMAGFGTDFSIVTWLAWAVGNATSTLMITIPVFFLLRGLKRQTWKFGQVSRAVNWPEYALLFATAHVTLFAIFFLVPNVIFHSGAIFVMFPLAIWSALRFGMATNGTWLMSIVFVSAFNTANGFGPFVVNEPTFSSSIFHLHMFSLSLCMAGMITNGAMFDRRKLQVSIQSRNEQLTRLSVTDHLTGIANRRNFDTTLSMEWQRAVRNGSSISLILIDIDHFKSFNDRYGHDAGDVCLINAANVIEKAASRSTDQVARIGGEEFACILPGEKDDGMRVVAEDIRKSIEAAAIPHDASPTAGVVTVSLGCASASPRRGDDMERLFKAADVSLYEAKDQGRNRCVFKSLSEYS